MTTETNIVHTASSDNTEQHKRPPLIYKILLILCLMFGIGGSLTAVMTYINLGFGDGFMQSWLSSFVIVALVMIPVGMSMTALLTKLTAKLMPNHGEKIRNLVIGVLMAVIMESLMAFVTAANTIGFADFFLFSWAWLHALLAALPIGLSLMLAMSLTVKPKIERFLRS